MRLAAAVVAAGVALAATAATAQSGESPVPTRDCSTRGDPSDGVPVRFVRAGDVVIGPASFSGLRLLSTSSRLDRGADGRFFAKAAAKVLWGRPVTVTVSGAHRPALALVYARPNRLTTSIRFQPCPPGTRMYGSEGRLRRVTGFPGGLSFTRRGCYRIEVRAEGRRTYSRTVALGVASCP